MDTRIFLLADDDMDDRDMFCEALEEIDKNIFCHTAENGRDALSLLNKLPIHPQLIFLDINMPVLNGWQCLEKIKNEGQYDTIPVIIISTSSHQREMDIAKKLGAICYFTKPHDFDALKDILHAIASNIGPGLISTLKNLETHKPEYIRAL
ncbi:MAG: response regulator [Bacteroidetes bacterium 43-93]|nr:response regulator [Bacteroidota bacterium]OJW96708.1 MAG: response regulator [Bacteroidetes bacterium 43-93]